MQLHVLSSRSCALPVCHGGQIAAGLQEARQNTMVMLQADNQALRCRHTGLRFQQLQKAHPARCKVYLLEVLKGRV